MSTTASAPRPVLVGYVDNSSEPVVRWAAAEAERRCVPRRVVHVSSAAALEAWAWRWRPATGDMGHLQRRLHANLEVAAAAVREQFVTSHAGIPFITTVTAATPGAALVTASEGACVLVVGRGRRPLTGLTVAAVTSRAHCPVVVVPTSTTPSRAEPMADSGQKWIVMGLEGSPECDDALGFAFQEAALRQLPLLTLHAWWAQFGHQSKDTLGEGDAIKSVADASMAGFLERWTAAYPEVEVRSTVARMRAAEALVEASHGAELLVVGSRGRGGFAGLLPGSVCRQVLHGSHSPVAVVRRGQLSCCSVVAGGLGAAESA